MNTAKIFSQPDYQGDLKFTNNSAQTIKVEIAVGNALCYEGLNQYQSSNPNNRHYQIQNGTKFRKYFGDPVNLNETYNPSATDNGNGIEIGPGLYLVYRQNSTQVDNTVNFSYGYSKYKVTFSIDNNVTHVFYFNTADSKFQKIIEYPEYAKDFDFKYYGDNLAIQVYANGDYLSQYDIIPYSPDPNFIVPELKAWKICFGANQTTPISKTFYVRSTPFGMRPDIERTYRANVNIDEKLIFDGVYNTTETTIYGYNTVNGVTNFPNYYTNPDIPSGFNDPGNTYMTPSSNFYGENNNFGTNFIFNSESTIDLGGPNGGNKKMWVSSIDLNPEYSNDAITLKEGSKIILRPNSKLFTYKLGKFKDEGSIKELSAGSMFWAWNHSQMEFTGNNVTHTFNNGATMQIDGGATLVVGNNTTLVFDGTGTNLKLNSNSIVNFGQNAKIEFKNGAYLNANGSSISSINPSLPGEGIILENVGASTVITGCTFNNLTSAVTMYNDNMTSANTHRYIYGNVFNMINGNRYGLHTYNAHNSTIQNNTFNLSVGDGFGLVMRYSLPPGEDETPPIYSININNNAFNNGTVSAAFLCYTSEYIPMNVSYNNFNSASLYNVIGRHITGDIRYNTLNSVTAGSQCKSIELTQSTPGLYSNTVSSNYKNLYSYDSYENLAPIPENGNFILTGGYNRFTSIGNGNFYFYGGKALLDYGYNCFLKNINQAYNHLEGAVNEPTLLYYMRNNDFNNSYTPVHSLVEYESGSVVVPFVEGSNYTCQISTDAGNIWIIRDLGNGVSDTIYSKPDNTGYQQPQDASLYSTAMARKTGSLYFDAASYFKALINNHAASAYTDACLYSLYECHERLDTSSSQEIMNILYGSLKIYLENKILSELYSDEFNFNAYNIVLMCETNMTDYNSAMAGYEFIALYHPEAYIRLLASWDYAELEELINGGGGLSSRNENMSDEDYLLKLTKKINKSVSEDPVRVAVKKSYNRVKSENTARDEKEIYSRNKNTKEAENELTMMKQIEYNFNSRTLNVLRNAKTMTREEKSQRQMEDILTTLKDKKGSYTDHGTNTLPENYNLSQNYPNPFNPVTKINYALPKQGFVTLKIYDITGREVKVLVNEFKQAGYYTVDFNGSNLASGVYFYRIQSGSFISVKKMVLVK